MEERAAKRETEASTGHVPLGLRELKIDTLRQKIGIRAVDGELESGS
jgi:hypothetical protein